MTSLARSERAALCDLAEQLGPAAPTLCDGWNVRRLMAHLWVREHSPTGAPGIVVPMLGRLTDRAMDNAEGRDFDALVAAIRHPRFTVMALPGIDSLVNGAEYFVHHEDIRRAQPEWEPRTLDERESAIVWKLVGNAATMLLRKCPVPLTLRRPDTGATVVVKSGAEPVVVEALPAELLLWIYGRDAVSDLTISGPSAAVAKVSSLARGI